MRPCSASAWVPRARGRPASRSCSPAGAGPRCAPTITSFGKPFTKDSGIGVAVDGAGPSLGKIRAMVRSGKVTWDLCDSSIGASEVLGRDGMLEPIDYAIVDKGATMPGFAMPWCYGTSAFSYVLAYDRRATGGAAPRDWADFWDVKKFPGKRTMRRGMQGVLEAALLADGVAREKLYPLDVGRALAKVRQIKDVTVFWESGADSERLLRQGEVVMGNIWSTRARWLDETTRGRITWTWQDGLLTAGVFNVPKGNPAGKDAMRLLAAMTNPERQVMLLKLLGSGPANPAASALVPPALRRIDPSVRGERGEADRDAGILVCGPLSGGGTEVPRPDRELTCARCPRALCSRHERRGGNRGKPPRCARPICFSTGGVSRPAGGASRRRPRRASCCCTRGWAACACGAAFRRCSPARAAAACSPSRASATAPAIRWPLPRPLDFMEREARDVLPRVLEAAGVERCLLVGHSDGASIAAIAAGMRQDARLAGLVLMAPHFFVEDVSIAAIAAARDAYAAGDLRARLAPHHAEVEVAFHGWNDTWLDPAFRSWNITRYLPSIRVPVLLIQGEADPYGTVAQIRAAERLIAAPVRTLLLPGIGHDPARQARAATVEAIASFARFACG